MSSAPRPHSRVAEPYRHEAMFYAGEDEFADRSVSFVRDAVHANERVLVVVAVSKLNRLRDELGADGNDVEFADMAEVGQNPARIIPVWRDFVASSRGRTMRGIGEPIWASRAPDEMIEAQRHEALLNIAFDGAPNLWLLCPYDVSALGGAVLDEARRSHPYLDVHGAHETSAEYSDVTVLGPFDAPLGAPAAGAVRIDFGIGTLHEVRRFAGERASAWGLSASRTADLVLAVDEVATNSLRHAGGAGSLLMWRDDEAVFAEVRDDGRIADPLVGRVRPSTVKEGGFGLWLVNQLCDLVQVRTFPTGSVVRLRMNRA